MQIGTSHFVSFEAAVRYYSEYGDTAADVAQKISDGQIKIGAPALAEGQRLVIIDDGCRYAIQILSSSV